MNDLRGIKELLKHTFLFNAFVYFRQMLAVWKWHHTGRPLPPPSLVKQNTVKYYARLFDTQILVETGTYLGDMVYAVRKTFKTIYSIELDEVLCRKAQERFAKFRHITILPGNSSEVLPEILTNIRESVLFWLDAHYSGSGTARADLETPILQELRYILAQCALDCVILIDDARLFTGENDYPSLEQLHTIVSQSHPDRVVEVHNDIIRIHKSIEQKQSGKYASVSKTHL